ncbi:MAG TPA: phytanoyl-CoA dioxygenase family protein [Burkholderiales bacterium]|nr:phytanoyl-CoA dioxygenase family protein [Burkholderiales bacterium]
MAQSLQFETDGYAITPPLLTTDECAAITAQLSEQPSVCTRNALRSAWCAALARDLLNRPELAAIMPPAPVAVQCTLFEKSPSQNWLVALHQDVTIPVAKRVNHPTLQGWSRKEGSLFVQPPVSVLEELVAVRIQLDDCEGVEGVLRVVTKSHVYGRLEHEAAYALRDRTGETLCPVPRGGALVMRPLLLHASSKLSAPVTRRVLHFLYGSSHLPLGLDWAIAV